MHFREQIFVLRYGVSEIGKENWKELQLLPHFGKYEVRPGRVDV